MCRCTRRGTGRSPSETPGICTRSFRDYARRRVRSSTRERRGPERTSWWMAARRTARTMLRPNMARRRGWCWGRRVRRGYQAGVGAQHAAPLPVWLAQLDGVEPDLQQLQPVVVVLPKEVLQARREQAHRRCTARQLGRTPRHERDRRQRGRHVAEAALTGATHEDFVVGRAQQRGDARRRVDERGAGRDLRLATRLPERTRPDCVRARDGEGERCFAVGPVLVEYLEDAVG